MSEPKITIKTNDLLAMNLLASRDEAKAVQNSVLVDQSPESGTLLVATDGRRLGVLRILSESNGNFEFLIPRTLIERFALLKYSGSVAVRAEAKEVILEGDAFRLNGEAMPATFPKWRKVLPKNTAEWAELGLAANYYDSWHEIATLLGGSGYFTMKQSKPLEPIEIILDGVSNFYGLLMPRKTGNSVSIPDWIKTL